MLGLLAAKGWVYNHLVPAPRRRVTWLWALALLAACHRAPRSSTTEAAVSEPLVDAPRCDDGVPDPYRYLEKLDDPEVDAWMRAQSQAAAQTLDAIPGLDALARDHAAIDALQGQGASMLNELDDGSSVFLRDSAGRGRLIHRDAAGRERVLHDPRDYAPERGHDYVINYIKPSWSGELIVVSLTKQGEELSEMIIIEVASGERRPETITHCWPSDGGGVHWLPDDSGFVYLHYPIIDPKAEGFLHDMAAVLHRLGDDPRELHVLLSAAHDPALGIQRHDFPKVSVPSQASAYAIAEIGGATPFGPSYISPIADLVAGEPRWRPLFRAADKVAHFVIVEDRIDRIDRIDLLSARNSDTYEILRVPLGDPELARAEVLVRPDPGEVLVGMAVSGEQLVYVSQRDGVVARLHHRGRNGVVEQVELPAAFGTLVLDGGAPVPGASVAQDRGLQVSGGGWLTPMTRYRYDFAARRLAPLELEPNQRTSIDLSLSELVVEERLVTAADGVEVPLSLIYRRGLERDGARPTLMFGYGAYGLSATPFLFAPFILWAQRGGVVAIAHVRGGGEKGEGWHQDGRMANKANTWGDLIACAEQLQSDAWAYTSPEHTAVWGISAGGVMVGRSITERPELFAAGLAQVAMLNPARLEVAANGDNSSKEFGDIDDPRECPVLLEMDAYLHVRDDVDYPALLVTAGIHDPRVDPWESTKFAARVQAANAAIATGGPTLVWIDYAGGHGSGETNEARHPKIAKALGFCLWQTGHPDFQP